MMMSVTANKPLPLPMNDWISLDVGGRKMSTTRSTLVSNSNSALANMFNPYSGLEPARMVNGSYTIDADPDCFQVLLNWLRYRKVMFPTSYQNYENVSAVAEVYGILDLVEHIKSLQNKERKVVLDVGGTIMCTSRETFDKMRREMFEKSETKDERIIEQVDGSYFIDADPSDFKKVLDRYRDDVWKSKEFRLFTMNESVIEEFKNLLTPVVNNSPDPSFNNKNYELVYGMIKKSMEVFGLARDSIYNDNQVQEKMSQVEIENTLDYLSSEGHIYTTIDDDHFKAT